MTSRDRGLTVENPDGGFIKKDAVSTSQIAQPAPSQGGGKNPYEIRLDVLKLAQEMAGLQYKAAETEFLAAQTYGMVAPPKAATAADIISEATMLYEFVSNNSRTITKK